MKIQELKKFMDERVDLIELSSTDFTSSISQPIKTLSEYLKENDAYEIFIETCVAHFLKYTSAYDIFKKDNIPVSLSNAFTWYDSNRDGNLWLGLFNKLPKDIIYDMNEIVFAEVDKRIAEQKIPSENLTENSIVYDVDEIVSAKFITTEEFDQILEQKTSKGYMVFVEGKNTPRYIHNSYASAVTEAKRLSTKLVGLKVSIVEIVKEFKSRIKIEEIN